MCGRIDILRDPLCEMVSAALGIAFSTESNHDLRPTQVLATVALEDNSLKQLNATWGIKPAWAKKLLINAQAETVTTKKTFARAFATHRCLIPCSGWYEWRDEGRIQKQKYHFCLSDNQPLYMAGIYFRHGDDTQVVTLTTDPTEQCKPYHNRMPLFIQPEHSGFWFASSTELLQPLLHCDPAMSLSISQSH